MSKAILRGWAKMWPTTALAGTLALLLLLHGPALMSAVWGNAGMLTLRDALLARAESVPAVYSTFNALEGDAKTIQAVQSFRRAVALDGDNSAARWALGREALATGDAATAVDALEPLEEGMAHNPLLYQDVLTAFSYANKPAQVIALYECFPPCNAPR